MTSERKDPTAMTEKEVLDAIRDAMVQIKVPGGAEAQPATTWEELDVDSLDLVEIVRALEDRFGVEVPDERLEGVQSVGDAVQLILVLDQERAAA